MKFSELNLSKEVLSALESMKFEDASPIQQQAIPLILAKHDLIGQAQTGTGKTAAFGIPLVEGVNHGIKHTQALILCPTRELASQITEELRKIARFKAGLSVIALYGGQSIDTQLKVLKRGANIIVATPGRLMDHLRRGSVRLTAVKQVILDEVDEMLDKGFKQDIEEIISRVPREERQTIFFSATISERIMSLAVKFLKNPKQVKIASKELSSPNIEQFYIEVKEKFKTGTLTNVIKQHNLNLCLVFCNTKRKVDELVKDLKIKGYFASGLHGDMVQSQRDRVINSFKRGETKIVVATNVAARGVHVENIEGVVNYDMPQAAEHYVHRIGRTGRAGKPGKAFTFVLGSQLNQLNEIKRFSRGQIVSQRVPAEALN
jgi:ATP-dependent RNA helicase DeaD